MGFDPEVQESPAFKRKALSKVPDFVKKRKEETEQKDVTVSPNKNKGGRPRKNPVIVEKLHQEETVHQDETFNEEPNITRSTIPRILRTKNIAIIAQKIIERKGTK